MKYKQVLRVLTAILPASLLCFSCSRADVAEPPGHAGQTLVKIIGGGSPATILKTNIDLDNKPVTILAADIRRDITDEAELSKTMIIMVKADTAIVKAANPAYSILPAALFSVGAETPETGGYYTIVLKPGEFAKGISITIPNPKLLNPGLKYALGFTITTADANSRISSQHSIITEIITANAWDGVYLNIGNPAVADHGFSDITDPALVWFADQEYSLITLGPTTCVVGNNGLAEGLPGYIFSSAGTASYFGSYGLVISFDPSTNNIIGLYNYYGDPTMPICSGCFPISCPGNGNGPPLYAACNTRRAVLDPSGINAVQANKDIIIKHFILQPSVVPPPSIRCYFDETWQYLRPR